MHLRQKNNIDKPVKKCSVIIAEDKLHLIRPCPLYSQGNSLRAQFYSRAPIFSSSVLTLLWRMWTHLVSHFFFALGKYLNSFDSKRLKKEKARYKVNFAINEENHSRQISLVAERILKFPRWGGYMGRREWEMALRSCRNRVSLKTCPSDPLLKASGTDKDKSRKNHTKWIKIRKTTSGNQILSVSLIAKRTILVSTLWESTDSIQIHDISYIAVPRWNTFFNI